MADSYAELKIALAAFIPAARLIDDPLRTLAYGTDASFYRLIPRLVVKVVDEAEVVRILDLTRQFQTPVTFRAAGTSLSGQAITDSVLLLLSGDSWRDYRISDNGAEISLQPGIIGAWANEYLAPYQRKIGPDPASIDSAKIGGIAANNASGMCCGTAQNSYNTLAGMRVVLADGAVLDSRDEQSVFAFRKSHAELLDKLNYLAKCTRGNSTLNERIRHKYRLKNTTGYSLNALVDYAEPIDILQHLMIGSEGSLGFISEISYRTVPDYPHKATALMLFPDVESACRGVANLKHTPVTAVELMDRAALASVEDAQSMPAFLKSLGQDVAALLVDARAADEMTLKGEVELILAAIDDAELVQPAHFTYDAAEYKALWDIRKGLFPAVGAVRRVGTTVIIEDVAFPVPQLAAAVRKLQALFKQYHYHEALIFGHALEGNLHFVFTQDFGTEPEVRRYEAFMAAVSQMVTAEFDGSLKAEHGTGRNMAPFVEMEWGADAYKLMWQIKRLFDPDSLLNPGVVLNDDPDIHIKNLKPLPQADSLVDKCIECGFCEAICPSRNLTLTPRQRIVGWREISRLKSSGEDADRLAEFEKQYVYQGLDTCAVDGLCAIRCPVGIDAGSLTKKIRHSKLGSVAPRVGQWVNDHFSTASALTRNGLKLAGFAQNVLGDKLMQSISHSLRRISKDQLPLWSPSMPRSAAKLTLEADSRKGSNGTVVYFASCVSRTMGPAKNDPHQNSLHQSMISLLKKAGFRIIIPDSIDGLCCGMPLESKGLIEQGNNSLNQLEDSLWAASGEGEFPVLCDTSPCTYRMLEGFERPLNIYEPAGFINQFLKPHLEFSPLQKAAALHITCTSRKMNLDGVLLDLMRACVEKVVVSEEKGCCGFAGDKGFMRPELNASALRHLKESLPSTCLEGYSNSRTCEIGLSLHSGIPYQSIVYLVDECTRSKGHE